MSLNILDALRAGILALNTHESPHATDEAGYDWLEANGTVAVDALCELRDQLRAHIEADKLAEATRLVLAGEGATLLTVPATMFPGLIAGPDGTATARAVDLLREAVESHDTAEARERIYGERYERGIG